MYTGTCLHFHAMTSIWKSEESWGPFSFSIVGSGDPNLAFSSCDISFFPLRHILGSFFFVSAVLSNHVFSKKFHFFLFPHLYKLPLLINLLTRISSTKVKRWERISLLHLDSRLRTKISAVLPSRVYFHEHFPSNIYCFLGVVVHAFN